MYFSEQGNVDDDATFITIFLVHSIDSVAVCSLQMSYTDFEAGLHLPHPFLLCQCVLSSCIDNFAKIGPKLAYLRKSWMIAKKTTRKPFLVFVFYRQRRVYFEYHAQLCSRLHFALENGSHISARGSGKVK